MGSKPGKAESRRIRYCVVYSDHIIVPTQPFPRFDKLRSSSLGPEHPPAKKARSPMPSLASKSSVRTARRANRQAHIPYRGDNPVVGRRTGIAIPHVQRGSDGFEPFEEVMQQADGQMPPRPKGRKKLVVYKEDDDEDEQYSDEDNAYGEKFVRLHSM
ncbi:hypothetical protein EST38_g8161 [Candolleomyces aberdarensis]|uniref:Uncharacterized protein n=1 Tax=Candolleomyces aberdarensis TaxID=2316362 RepID=A0A4Q2DF34_9AGAR|nr:hypothetical protein EST38_g8161 [Candolleomyces aberdarensis]